MIMSQVTISVSGRQYRLACDEGEEQHLSELGEKLDGMITELREAFGEIGDQRLTVMAAILALDRLDEAEQQVAGAQSGATNGRSSGNESADIAGQIEERLAAAVEEAAARIEDIAAEIQAERVAPTTGSSPAGGPA